MEREFESRLCDLAPNNELTQPNFISQHSKCMCDAKKRSRDGRHFVIDSTTGERVIEELIGQMSETLSLSELRAIWNRVWI